MWRIDIKAFIEFAMDFEHHDRRLVQLYACKK